MPESLLLIFCRFSMVSSDLAGNDSGFILLKHPVRYIDHQYQVGSDEEVGHGEQVVVVGTPFLEAATDEHAHVGDDKAKK